LIFTYKNNFENGKQQLPAKALQELIRSVYLFSNTSGTRDSMKLGRYPPHAENEEDRRGSKDVLAYSPSCTGVDHIPNFYFPDALIRSFHSLRSCVSFPKGNAREGKSVPRIRLLSK
jgi:hypothetical protein